MAGGASVIGLGYDVQGNLANRNGMLYGFDYGNRMRSGGPETYRYDVQGRRIRSSSSAGLVYSLYAQSGQLLFQRDERAGKRRQYVYLGGSLVAETSVPLAGGAATVTYQHTDALGSPVATTDSSKTVLQRSEYEPYGYLLNRTMEDGPGYTGHVTDAATGLVYMQQRYYDPLIGQHFLSVDPVTAYSPGGAFNQYWYGNANPYGFTDPDGLDPDTDLDPYLLAGGGLWKSSSGSNSISAGTEGKADEKIDSKTNPTDELDYRNRQADPSEIARIIDSAIRKTNSKDFREGRSGENVGRKRYVYTERYGWIDLKHVASAANNPFSYIPGGSELVGLLVEISQLRNEPESAMNRSDFYSNYVGGEAAHMYLLTSWRTHMSKGEYVEQMLRNAGAKPHD